MWETRPIANGHKVKSVWVTHCIRLMALHEPLVRELDWYWNSITVSKDYWITVLVFPEVRVCSGYDDIHMRPNVTAGTRNKATYFSGLWIMLVHNSTKCITSLVVLGYINAKMLHFRIELFQDACPEILLPGTQKPLLWSRQRTCVFFDVLW